MVNLYYSIVDVCGKKVLVIYLMEHLYYPLGDLDYCPADLVHCLGEVVHRSAKVIRKLG